jgi:phenylalanyl-tRNA synthetase beta subunit
VAIGLNLQDVSRTLTDDDADAVVAQVVADLKRSSTPRYETNKHGIDQG